MVNKRQGRGADKIKDGRLRDDFDFEFNAILGGEISHDTAVYSPIRIQKSQIRNPRSCQGFPGIPAISD